jgi:CcmD family protein
VSGFGYLVAAYVAAGLLYGLYTLSLWRRERALERQIDHGSERTISGGGPR